MKIISTYNLFIDRNKRVNFIVDSDETFKAYGVSLFNISMEKLYGNHNFLTQNQDYMSYLKKLVSHNDYRLFNEKGIRVSYDFSWQYELFIDRLSDSFYLEKWGLCTKISFEDFLEIFQDLHLFLERWNSKERILHEIKKLLPLREKKDARKRFYLKGPTSIKNDEIQLFLNESDFEIKIEDYLKEVTFPVHLK